MEKCFIPSDIVETEKLQDGDTITLIMPGFCSGDYSFRTIKNRSNEFTLDGAPSKAFDGCNGYVVRRNGVNYKGGKPVTYDYRYTCTNCNKLYVVNRVMSEKDEKCPMCGHINKAVNEFYPIDTILWHMNYKKQETV